MSTEKRAMVLDTEVINVQEELVRQEERWGEQNWPDGTGPEVLDANSGEWFAHVAASAKYLCDRAAADGCLTWRHILLEEVFEAMAESDEGSLLTELNQVAAVAAQWRKSIRRRQIRRAEMKAGDVGLPNPGQGSWW